MKIAIDSDSVGEPLKKIIIEHLEKSSCQVTDLDYSNLHMGDYPDVAFYLATKIKEGQYERGILLCGTGLGMAMCACKVPGIFAGTCHDVYSAERLQKSNDAQVITMGARVIGPELAKKIVDAWLASTFLGGGSTSKVNRMRELDRNLVRGH